MLAQSRVSARMQVSDGCPHLDNAIFSCAGLSSIAPLAMISISAAPTVVLAGALFRAAVARPHRGDHLTGLRASFSCHLFRAAVARPHAAG